MIYAIVALLMVVGSFFSFYRASRYYARRAEEAKRQRDAEKAARAKVAQADDPPA